MVWLLEWLDDWSGSQGVIINRRLERLRDWNVGLLAVDSTSATLVIFRCVCVCVCASVALKRGC